MENNFVTTLTLLQPSIALAGVGASKPSSSKKGKRKGGHADPTDPEIIDSNNDSTMGVNSKKQKLETSSHGGSLPPASANSLTHHELHPEQSLQNDVSRYDHYEPFCLCLVFILVNQ